MFFKCNPHRQERCKSYLMSRQFRFISCSVFNYRVQLTPFHRRLRAHYNDVNVRPSGAGISPAACQRHWQLWEKRLSSVTTSQKAPLLQDATWTLGKSRITFLLDPRVWHQLTGRLRDLMAGQLKQSGRPSPAVLYSQVSIVMFPLTGNEFSSPAVFSMNLTI